MDVVLCDNVTRRFGDASALAGVSFTMAEGEIFGVLGPPGAGKTTLINCLIGMDRPTSGSIELFGMRPSAQQHALSSRIGVQPQHPALIQHISVAETMRFFSSLHSRVLPWEDLLESLGLGEEKRTKVHRLSAAQQQKVSIALSFLHQPELLILDELTAAIEPEQRMEIWDAVNTMCEYGTSVFLATQDVSEAEHLCDQVGIMDAGALLAVGTVPGLIRSCVGESAAFLSLDQPAGQAPDLTELEGVTRIVQEGLSLTVYGQGGFVHRILAHLAMHGVQVTRLEVTEPKFSDVFSNLTGRDLHEDSA